MNEQKQLSHRLAVILMNEDDVMVEKGAATETQSKQTNKWLHSCRPEDMKCVCVCLSICALSVFAERKVAANLHKRSCAWTNQAENMAHSPAVVLIKAAAVDVAPPKGGVAVEPTAPVGTEQQVKHKVSKSSN